MTEPSAPPARRRRPATPARVARALEQAAAARSAAGLAVDRSREIRLHVGQARWRAVSASVSPERELVLREHLLPWPLRPLDL
jgi:hypothetical protein